MTDLINVPLGSLQKGFLSTPINSVQTEGIVIDTVFDLNYDGGKQYMTILNPDGAEILTFTGQTATGELTGVTRGEPIREGGDSSANLHGSNVQVVLSNPHSLYQDIKEAINSKLDKSGGVVTGPITIVTEGSSGFTLSVFTTVERDAIVDPQNGDMIYNSDEGVIQYYSAGLWISLEQSDTIFTNVGGAGNENKAVKLDDQGKIDYTMIDNTVPEFISTPSGNDDTGKAVVLNEDDQIDPAFIPPQAEQDNTETMYPIFGDSVLRSNNGVFGNRATLSGTLADRVPVFYIGERDINFNVIKQGKPIQLQPRGVFQATSIPASASIIDPAHVAIEVNLGEGEYFDVQTYGFVANYFIADDSTRPKTLKLVGRTADGAPDLNNIKFQLDNINGCTSINGASVDVSTSYTLRTQNIRIEHGDFFIFSTTNNVGVRQVTDGSIQTSTGLVWTSGDGVNFSQPDPATITDVRYTSIHMRAIIKGNKHGTYAEGKKFVQVGFKANGEESYGSGANMYSANYAGCIKSVNEDGSFEVSTNLIQPVASATQVGRSYEINGQNITLNSPNSEFVNYVIGTCISNGYIKIQPVCTQFLYMYYTSRIRSTFPSAFRNGGDQQTLYTEVTASAFGANALRENLPYPLYGTPKEIQMIGTINDSSRVTSSVHSNASIYPTNPVGLMGWEPNETTAQSLAINEQAFSYAGYQAGDLSPDAYSINTVYKVTY